MGGGAEEPKLSADEGDRARAVGLDHLTSRREHPVRLADPERHDRVGVLLIAKTLVGVGRIKDFGRRIDGKDRDAVMAAV